MKLIKPNRIAFLQRTYGLADLYRYVTTPILFFDLKTSKILPENIQWKKVSEALGQEALDQALPKTTSEFLVAGHAYAKEENTKEMSISIRLGEINKSINIYGERRWQRNIIRQWQPTDTEPFSKVPLLYEYSYGGENVKTNPVGTGFDEKEVLPAVEDTDKMIRKPKQKSLPVGTMPLPIMWPQRAKYHGNYKGDWFDKYFPALPPDTDLRLFNTAPEDQQFSSFLNGDERYYLWGITADQQEISGQLPNIKARSFITYNGSFKEVPLVLDTVWFIPDQHIGALIFRGQVEVSNAEADEVSQVMLSYENLMDIPKTLSHYQSVLKLRTDPKTAAAHMMNEAQLTPERTEQEILERKGKLEAQQQQVIADLKEQQKLSLDNLSENVNSSQLEIPEPELSPFDSLLDEDVKNGDIDLSKVLDQVDLQLEELQKDSDKKLAELERDEGANTQVALTEIVSVEQAIDNFDCEKVQPENGELFKNMSKKEIRNFQLQQKKIQQMAISKDDVVNLDEGVATGLRELVLLQIAEGRNMSAKDITGVDLSGLVFDQIDFSHSVLSFGDLSNSKFINCRFEEAMFNNADLTHCIFENCNMQQCDLSGIKGSNPQFMQCDLSLSHWRGCVVDLLYLSDCELKQSQFFESQLKKSRFSQSKLLQCTFSNCDLIDCDFEQCNIIQTIFNESILDVTRWYGSQLERCVMQLCPARLVSFVEAKLRKVIFSVGTNLTRVNFYQSELSETSFRTLSAQALIANKTMFNKCDFSEADLAVSCFNDCEIVQCIAAATDLTGCRINQCSFYRSRFRNAKFIDCDLSQVDMLDVDLMWAQIQNTSLKDCKNLSSIAKRDAKQRATKEGGNDEQTRIA